LRARTRRRKGTELEPLHAGLLGRGTRRGSTGVRGFAERLIPTAPDHTTDVKASAISKFTEKEGPHLSREPEVDRYDGSTGDPRPHRHPLRRRSATGFVAAALMLTAAGPLAAKASSAPVTLNIVGYSVVKDAFAKLTAAYQKTAAGKNVTFNVSFGPSGTEASDVIAGQPADIANLALEPDMAKLVAAGDVSPNWDKGIYGGMVTDSVVVFIVRKGNPEHIKTWADLVKPGVKVLTPNPFTSGGARWNILAAYGAQRELGESKAKAEAYLLKLFQHVPTQDASASAALADFLSGTGDVLLDYEDDAILAQKSGADISYVIPPQTILIQNPLAVSAKSANAAAAKAFASYLLSSVGQTIWAQEGFRPVDPKVAAKFHFPKPKKLFSISYLGGWTSVVKTFFDPTNGIVAKVEQAVGESTSSSG
jgi:sulfate/thiosulfate transport system substrate-binding protein